MSELDYDELGRVVEIVGKRGWVNFPQGAKILGVHPQTLRLWAKAGLIETFTMGQRQVIMLEEINRFKDSGNRIR